MVADAKGQPFTLQTMRTRFWRARKAAGATFQIRDLRAKSASDSGSLHAAQLLLGHADESTTAGYRRKGVGERAQPIMRAVKTSAK